MSRMTIAGHDTMLLAGADNDDGGYSDALERATCEVLDDEDEMSRIHGSLVSDQAEAHVEVMADAAWLLRALFNGATVSEIFARYGETRAMSLRYLLNTAEALEKDRDEMIRKAADTLLIMQEAA